MAVRTQWTDLPDETRAAVVCKIGPVFKAESAEHGVMSDFASTVHTATETVFLKGTPADAPLAWTYRHEADVTRAAPFAPRVRWQVEAGGWKLYAYEHLPGQPPDLSPGSLHLQAVMSHVHLLSCFPWPKQVSKKPLVSRLARFIPDGCAHLLEGTTLAHTDLSAHNMLLSTVNVWFLDWALSCPGPAFADAALMVPRLILAGHTPQQAHETACRTLNYRTADPQALAVFSRTIFDFWTHRTQEDPLPGRVELADAAQAWMKHLQP